VAAGAAEGIESGAPKVAASSVGLANAAKGGMASGGASPAKGKGGGLTIQVAAGAIAIHGGSDALQLTERALAELLERVAMSQGLAPT
jgi:hypothetical protein